VFHSDFSRLLVHTNRRPPCNKTFAWIEKLVYGTSLEATSEETIGGRKGTKGPAKGEKVKPPKKLTLSKSIATTNIALGDTRHQKLQEDAVRPCASGLMYTIPKTLLQTYSNLV